MIYQRTIKSDISVIGVGLHSGLRVDLTLKPAKEDQGIVFVRKDLDGAPEIVSNPLLINDTRLSSTFVVDGVRVATVEHLMSAFACYGIDNIIVELSSQEIPIMDGSSNSFLYLIDQAGIVEQRAKKKYIRIKEVVEIDEGDKWVRCSPFAGYKVKLSIDFGNHPVFKPEFNSFEVDFSKHSYVDEISRARTFGFMYEVEYMRKNGLSLGGNLNNAVVIDEETILNDGGLRFNDEFVRHKILDAIGDFYIIGHQFIGAFEGYKSGHAINNKLLRKLLDTPESWEYVVFDDPEDVPKYFFHINNNK